MPTYLTRTMGEIENPVTTKMTLSFNHAYYPDITEANIVSYQDLIQTNNFF